MSDLEYRIERFLNSLPQGEGILMTVSGGIDSMVLCHLIHRCELLRINPRPLAIAHCNFGLRQSDSDTDEHFVKRYAEDHQIPCFIERYNTVDYAQEHQLSIQMAARELRYEFFERLCQQHQFTYIAVAHHQDDQIETFFINLFRGTGLKGLQGMATERQRLIRPLLDVSRAQIEAYASSQHIPFREDRSNASDKYLRNRIRHHLLPLLNSLDPNARNGILNTIDNLKTLHTHSLEQIKAWQDLGFSSDSIHRILKNQRQNARFISKDFQATYNRGQWDIQPLDEPVPLKSFPIAFQEELQVLWLTEHQRIEYQLMDHLPVFSKEDVVYYWDADLLPTELVVRPWQEGDGLEPFGMGGQHRRVGRILIDKKVSPTDKRQVYVLEGSGRLYGILGIRAAEPARVGSNTLLYAVMRWMGTR